MFSKSFLETNSHWIKKANGLPANCTLLRLNQQSRAEMSTFIGSVNKLCTFSNCVLISLRIPFDQNNWALRPTYAPLRLRPALKRSPFDEKTIRICRRLAYRLSYGSSTFRLKSSVRL